MGVERRGRRDARPRGHTRTPQETGDRRRAYAGPRPWLWVQLLQLGHAVAAGRGWSRRDLVLVEGWMTTARPVVPATMQDEEQTARNRAPRACRASARWPCAADSTRAAGRGWMAMPYAPQTGEKEGVPPSGITRGLGSTTCAAAVPLLARSRIHAPNSDPTRHQSASIPPPSL